MTEVERLYRETPVESKKHALRLANYIEFLISKQRYLEAKFFFKLLRDKKPSHLRTIRLGYQISIATFDTKGVKHFDKLLCDYNRKGRLDTEIKKYQLKFYISTNNIKRAEECCIFLLNKKISREDLSLITRVCVDLNSFKILSSLVNFMKKEKLAMANPKDMNIKRIAIFQLINILIKRSHE